jgi:transcription factor Dp-1
LPQIAGGVGGGGVGGGGGGGGDAAEYEKLLAEKKRVQASIEKKNAHLQELVEQYKSYQALLRRNETRATRGETPNGIQLPFILVQTAPTATVEIEISEDQQLVHFDFNDAPFQIHDANYVLQQMALNEDGLSRLDLHRAEEGAEGGVGGGGGGGDAPAFAEIDGADFAAAAAAAAEVETETASPGEARRGTRGDDADDGGRGGGRSTRKK